MRRSGAPRDPAALSSPRARDGARRCRTRRARCRARARHRLPLCATSGICEVAHSRVRGRVPGGAVLDHRGGDVDAVRLTAELGHVTEDPTLAAAHLERAARQDLPVADQDHHLDRQQPAVRVFGDVVAALPGRGVDLELIGRCQRSGTPEERARSRCARAKSRSRRFSPSRSARTAVRAARTRRPCHTSR